MGQGASNAVIAPRAVFLGQAHHQGLPLLVDLRASHRLLLSGAIKLLCDKFAMPRENGIRREEAGHLFQRVLPQFLANGGQRPSLGVSQSHAAGDLVAQDTILRNQVFVAEQEFLMDRPGNIGE
jgi:hypothetical protein